MTVKYNGKEYELLEHGEDVSLIRNEDGVFCVTTSWLEQEKKTKSKAKKDA